MHTLAHRMAAACSLYPVIYSSPDGKRLPLGDMAGAHHGSHELHEVGPCVPRPLTQPALAKDNSDFWLFSVALWALRA